MAAPVVAGAAVVAKLAYKPAMELAKSLAKKYWSKGSNKEKIVKEAKDKGILEKFNNFKLKNDPSKPLKKDTGYGVKPTGSKKPTMAQQEAKMKASGGKVKKYAKGGGVRKAQTYG